MTIRRDLDFLVVAGLAAASLSLAMAGRMEQPNTGTNEQRPGMPASDEGGRGRQADTPSEIPARGWWDILKRVARQVSEDRVMAEAAGVTYYALLALFPALAALVSLYGLFADPNTIATNLDAVSGFMPGGGMQIVTDQLHSLAATSQRALGFGLLVSLAVSLWSANAATKALFDALNAVYREREERSFVLRTAVSLAFTIGSLAFVLIAMGSVVVLPAVLSFVGFGGTTDLLLKVLRWPLLLVAITIFLACVYRYGPSRAKARWRWVSWGGGFAAIVWILGSAVFAWYVANFGTYNKTYGSLGAAIGFMTWIWLSAIVVLVGAELNAEMEHQTARDTTAGTEAPIGARHASKADQVAEV
jgi:membrane protein